LDEYTDLSEQHDYGLHNEPSTNLVSKVQIEVCYLAELRIVCDLVHGTHFPEILVAVLSSRVYYVQRET